MPEETHGFLHFGKKEDEPEGAPKAPPPPAEEAHGLLHLFKKEEPPAPPAPPAEQPHGLFHFGGQAHAEEAKTTKGTAPEAPDTPQQGGLLARLFHRAPVTPEPASPQRPQIVRHHSFRSALYIVGCLCVLAALLPGILPDAYRFLGFIIGGALLLGGILLTGDWHPLTGMLGLRRVRLPTSTGGVAALLAEREAKEALEKVTQSADEAAKPAEPLARRLPPWRWPWSGRAGQTTAQEKQAEEHKDFTHVGLAGKVLMGVMAAVMGHGATLILQQTPRPASLSAFGTFAHYGLILLTIVLIIYIVTTRIRSFRRHWLSLFGLLRRVLVFFVVAAIAALVAGLLTKDPMLGQGYGEAIGGLVGMLAVLF
jgi:hypothetical protein